jgi:hypothetical protein
MHRRKLVTLVVTAVTATLTVVAFAVVPASSSTQDAEQNGEVEREALNPQPAASSGSCGVERWSIKTGTDADEAKINVQSTTPTTIASMRALAKPASLPSNNRIQPTETTVFRIQATLNQYKLENDSDYHLVISDSNGQTMITEIPDPACVGSSSRLRTSIQKARAAFNAKYTVTTSFQTANVPVTVTGVGFYDFLHGQTGVAPNGVELHAVLDIQFAGSTGSVTVTDPGTRSGTVGTATSLQVSATDTAGGTLSYGATGLPAGLSINTSTGLISGTPTTAGSYTPTVTATDSTGPSGSTSFTWTITAAGGCTPAQLLGNPGFETGTAAPWAASTGIVGNTTTEPAHSGSYDAWLNGYGSTHTDTLSQAVSLPTGCVGYSLGFWLHVDTAETSTTTAYDKLTVQVLNSSGSVLGTLATYSNVNAANGYTQHTFDLSAYAGQNITLKFTGTEDYTKQTSFVIDDTSLTIS